jgi:di/tricarboxylate transporter
VVALALLSGLTMVFTNMINAKASALLMFPIAVDSAATLGVDPMPLVVGVMVGAAGSFATPIGYQTNLMVMGPGGYRSSDYLRIGLPLSLIVWLLAAVLIPLRWKF